MKFSRQIRYFYLRFIRLRGTPHELALGMAFGVFTGAMPVMPFQIAMAVMLALLFKASKITAALGTWVSNPFNWYFLYYYTYKTGALLIGLPEKSAVFSSIMKAIRSGEEAMVIVGKIVGAGGVMLLTFLLGGLVIGLFLAVPCYFIFLHLFRYMAAWRQSRTERRKWRIRNQQRQGLLIGQKEA